MSIEIHAKALTKKFVHQVIIDEVSFHLIEGRSYVIQGSNGSGKSTLLKLILGYYSPNNGSIQWMKDKNTIPVESWAGYYAFASPYLELIEEYSLEEFVRFHKKVKSNIDGEKLNHWLKETKLLPHKKKWIKFFSSGMKQRLKLALCFSSRAPVLILDEPGSNLDVQGFEVLQQMLLSVQDEKMIVLASNDSNEYHALKQYKAIHL
jgi:ABC-type multidrug transport system ATPase subunit